MAMSPRVSPLPTNRLVHVDPPSKLTQDRAGGQPCLLMADVGEQDDVVRVRRVEGDRFFRLVQMPLADIDVLRRAGRLSAGSG
jgi:hypothetical protein